VTGASGTAYELVEIDDVLDELGELPPAGHEAVEEARAGRALTFRGPFGVFVLTLRPGENCADLECFVLLAVASRHGAFKDAEPAVLQIARDLDARTVAFRSVRKGWARRLGADWAPRGASESVRDVPDPDGSARL
jgi:hypothetical protein